jgi:hypothetical protein
MREVGSYNVESTICTSFFSDDVRAVGPFTTLLLSLNARNVELSYEIVPHAMIVRTTSYS